MPRFYLGVDTSKGYADFCFTDPDGRVLPGSQRYDDTPAGHAAVRRCCQTLLEAHADAELLVGLEASGGLERNWLRTFRELLPPQRGRVYQLNPLTIKRYLDRHLRVSITDRRSAQGIATYLREGLRPADRPFDPRLEGPRALVRLVRNRLHRQTIVRNELQSLLVCVHPELVPYARAGLPQWLLELLVRYPTSAALRRVRPATLARIRYLSLERARVLLAAAKQSVASVQDRHSAQVVRELAAELLASMAHVERLKAQLLEEFADDPEVQLLQSVPGIGPWTAVVLHLEYGALSRFHSAAAAVAFAGLDPRRKESGDEQWAGPISRHGHHQIRAALYMAVVAAIRCNPVLAAFHGRLRAAGKAPQVALTACMAKLVRLAYACVLTEKPFSVARYQELTVRHAQRRGANDPPAAAGAPAASAGQGAGEPVVGAWSAPVSRREAGRRKAATAPQVGLLPRARGHGAASQEDDTRSPQTLAAATSFQTST